MPQPPKARSNATPSPAPRHFAVIGAGMAGITCARTLMQAGHRVTVFEKSTGSGGRMATRSTLFGAFDHGAQYFTVRDPRFEKALQTAPGLCKPWSATTVRVLDAFGRVAAAGLPAREAHWVPTPGMNALVRHWAQPLVQAGAVELEKHVTRIERDALHSEQWQLHTSGHHTDAGDEVHVYSGFDAVLLAIPAAQAGALLQTSRLAPAFVKALEGVEVAPCWTLMVAFPQAIQPTMSHIGPQWNAARSTHHRVAWLAREPSKPARESLERWTVQASAAWSAEHLEDDAARVQGKLLKAFAEITGIRAEPALAEVHRWRHAQTVQRLGRDHLWDAKTGIGLCGDWCLGHRVENAFVSALTLALKVA
ncbi:MAG: FAD-dependent oxidoreductase [Burkholderiaceae bacterium]|nr:FAD-dependent oxidoreductase [Burkholderiaceae bacterium]MDZ4144821.1 FAD-dependent oxidoreductase [Burkholderiales bacterium]